MTALLERKPDALALFDTLAIAASDIKDASRRVFVGGDLFDGLRPDDRLALDDARSAAQRVLAALDAFEART